MLGTVAACLVMLALGLPGVIALRRLAAHLTPLEEWAYGLPLGVVVGSLALLVLMPAIPVLGTSSTARPRSSLDRLQCHTTQAAWHTPRRTCLR